MEAICNFIQLKHKEAEVAGYEKLFREGKITEEVYLDKRRELLKEGDMVSAKEIQFAQKEIVDQSTEIEKTAKQITQFDEKTESKMPPVIKVGGSNESPAVNNVSEQFPDSGGFRRVTVHYRFDMGSAGQVVTFSQGSMSSEELAQLVDRISDDNLASRIKRYMRNYKIVVERKTDMKRFRSQQDFVGYVSKEFPGCNDAAVVENQMAFYLIAAESGQPDKSMLL